jgi:hypothetical protein
MKKKVNLTLTGPNQSKLGHFCLQVSGWDQQFPLFSQDSGCISLESGTPERVEKWGADL